MNPTTTFHALGATPGCAREFEAILDAYRQAGGDPSALQVPNVATLVVSANQVLVAHGIEGITFESEELEHGVKARIAVAPHAHIERTVHLCFGMIPAEGLQEIIADYEIGAVFRALKFMFSTLGTLHWIPHRTRLRRSSGAS